MGGTLENVQINATSTLSTLSSYGSIQFGSGSYKDVPTSPWGSGGDYSYRLDSAIGTAGSAQAGINTWSASGGNDGPESNMIALKAAAEGAGWRTDSEKFILWFGDSYGHTPENTTGYPGPSVANTIAALNAADVQVLAFNVGGSYFTQEGQAAAISSGTGGALYEGFADVSAKILAALEEQFMKYNSVTLGDLDIAGLGIDITAGYFGAFDRSADRTFGFDVTFTGLEAGTYTFDIPVYVDKGVVAWEKDTITVTGTAVPEPATLLLLGLGLLGLGAAKRKM
jgi:hypothetical protein